MPRIGRRIAQNARGTGKIGRKRQAHARKGPASAPASLPRRSRTCIEARRRRRPEIPPTSRRPAASGDLADSEPACRSRQAQSVAGHEKHVPRPRRPGAESCAAPDQIGAHRRRAIDELDLDSHHAPLRTAVCGSLHSAPRRREVKFEPQDGSRPGRKPCRRSFGPGVRRGESPDAGGRRGAEMGTRPIRRPNAIPGLSTRRDRTAARAKVATIAVANADEGIGIVMGPETALWPRG